MNYGPLYAELLMHCTQLKLPRPWHRFAESVPCYGPLRNAASVMPSLEQKYGRRRLLRSGAAVRQRGGSPLPNPLLCNSTVVIHPLGGGLENQPRELIVDGLTLSGRSAPAAVLSEPAGIAAVDSLWLTCGSWDWTTLSALGLPAAPVNELADPRPESPADFVKQMTGPDAGQLPKPKRLILVGWQFAQLSRDRPPEFDRVLERADVLCGGFGLEPHDVLFWRPSPRDFQTLGRSAHHGRREDVVTALLRSVADSARPLAADRRRPRDLAATTERLR
ncbi:MAG: hypothetical protein JNL96_00805, partial [Planctomycetaceae bacterium]|nr:hypothetical protein [Planctomycetaceae bacterium]